MQKRMIEAMRANMIELAEQAEHFQKALHREGLVRTDTLKPSVKGFDSNAQRAEHKRAKRAKQHAKRQRKAPIAK